jgi:hypothetical protein
MEVTLARGRNQAKQFGEVGTQNLITRKIKAWERNGPKWFSPSKFNLFLVSLQ